MGHSPDGRARHEMGRPGDVRASVACVPSTHRRTDAEHAPQGGPDMPVQPLNTIDQETADRLSAEFHRCFSHFEARDDLFAPDTFFDLLPPMWRFQFEGSGEAFTTQLRSIAEGPVEIEVVRTVPTMSGFVTEHVETQHTPDGVITARRLHQCEVRNGQIHEVTTYCNGGWDDELRTRHAAEAPMVRPRPTPSPSRSSREGVLPMSSASYRNFTGTGAQNY